MAARFDMTLDSEAADRFTFAGIVYDVGAPFPHKDLGLDRMDMVGLWQTGRIRFVEPKAAKTPAEMTEDELEVATAPTARAPAGVNMRLSPSATYTSDPPRAATKRAQRR